MTGENQPPSPTPARVVPDRLIAAAADVPRPVTTIPGPLALVATPLLWLSPARLGVRLAASGWLTALVAYLLGVSAGVGLIQASTFVERLSLPFRSSELAPADLTWIERLREPFAAAATTLHSAFAPGGNALAAILVPLGIVAATPLLAVAVMPFAAAGEPARRVYGRSLRLVWWSTTLLIPLGIGWRTSGTWKPWLDLLPVVSWSIHTAAISLWLLWWLIVLLRSTRRYAGPADGPGWEPRIPLCERCGYTIIGLPYDTACPECGRPVADSLPQRRRQSPFVTAPGLRSAAATLRAVLFDKTFFDRLSIHNACARPAAWAIWIANAVPFAVSLGLACREGSGAPVSEMLANIVSIACGAVVVQAIVLGLLAALGAALIRQPLRPTAVAVTYAFWSTLPAAVGVLAFTIAIALAACPFDRFNAPAAHFIVAAIPLAIAVTGLGWGLIATILNYRRALTRTRFANA